MQDGTGKAEEAAQWRHLRGEVRHVVVAHRLRLFALGLDLLAVHLQALHALVVDLARLALRAEVAVAGDQLGDTAEQTRLALRRHALRLRKTVLQILNAQLQNRDEVLHLQILEAGVAAQVCVRLLACKLNTLLQQCGQVVLLSDDK